MSKPNVEVERREQILVAASRVISQKGIRDLRVSDVAEQASLSPGIIHYYFDNKATLIQMAFERNFERSLERRKSILASDVAAPVKLMELVDAYVPEEQETVEAWRVWAELWIQGLHLPELQALNDRAYGQWRRIVTTMIVQGQDEGTICDGDPGELANLLIGSLDGLALQVLLGSQVMTVPTMRSTARAFIAMISTVAQGGQRSA